MGAPGPLARQAIELPTFLLLARDTNAVFWRMMDDRSAWWNKCSHNDRSLMARRFGCHNPIFKSHLHMHGGKQQQQQHGFANSETFVPVRQLCNMF